MVDLTIVSAEMCSSIDGPLTANVGDYTQAGLFSERDWPTCSCPAYKFKKRTVNFGGRLVAESCKHIEEAQAQVCGWHSQYSGEPQNEPGICPRCGASTVLVQIGV